jgi:hypothetical protein
MVDVVVTLSGSGREALTAREVASTMGIGAVGGKVFAGLRNRGLISEGHPSWRRTPNGAGASVRTWKLNWDNIPDRLWGRIMVDFCRRHEMDIRSIMTEDDRARCEVAV